MFIKNRTLLLFLSTSFFAVTLQAQSQNCPDGFRLINVFKDVKEAYSWVSARSDCTVRPKPQGYAVCCGEFKSPPPQAAAPPKATVNPAGDKQVKAPPPKKQPKQPPVASQNGSAPSDEVEIPANMTTPVGQRPGARKGDKYIPGTNLDASAPQPNGAQPQNAQPSSSASISENQQATPSPQPVAEAGSCPSSSSYSMPYKVLDEARREKMAIDPDGRRGCLEPSQSGGQFLLCCKYAPSVDLAQGQEEDKPPALSEKELAVCQEAEQGIAKCEEDKASAEKNCDPEQGEMGQMTQGLNMAAAGLRTVGQMSLQLACSGMSTAAGAMNAALVGFETMCNSNRNSCLSSCGAAAKAFRSCPEYYSGYRALETSSSNVSDDLQKCRRYGSRVQSAQQNVAQVMGSVQASQQCAAFTAATSGSALCISNPFAPGCNGGPQNCDNPAFAASNVVCVCMKSPGDPRCLSTTSQAAPGFENIGGGTTPLLNTAGGLSGLGTENAGTGLDPGMLPMAGAAGRAEVGEDPGGKKGSGAALNPNSGANNSNGNSTGGGGGGFERNSQQVYAGTWGSGSGGGSFGSRSGGGGGTYSSNGTYRGPTDANPYRPPNSKFSPGLSGMTGPDGVTGPNSTTIWQKVSNRYQVKAYSLKQKP